MPSPADLQAQAVEDVERIARAFYEEAILSGENWPSWGELLEAGREANRGLVRKLLERDVIRVGARPNVQRPMEGQMEIGDFTACDGGHVYELGNPTCVLCGERFQGEAE